MKKIATCVGPSGFKISISPNVALLAKTLDTPALYLSTSLLPCPFIKSAEISHLAGKYL